MAPLTPGLTRLILVAAVALLIACGGAGEPDPTPTPAATQVPPEPEGVPGTVTASMDAECFLRDSFTAEIVIDYMARATNDSRVGRVRLLVDDAILEDSGIINDIEYRDREVIPVPPGSERNLRVEATPSGDERTASVRGTVRCPGTPPPQS